MFGRYRKQGKCSGTRNEVGTKINQAEQDPLIPHKPQENQSEHGHETRTSEEGSRKSVTIVSLNRSRPDVPVARVKVPWRLREAYIRASKDMLIPPSKGRGMHTMSAGVWGCEGRVKLEWMDKVDECGV